MNVSAGAAGDAVTPPNRLRLYLLYFALIALVWVGATLVWVGAEALLE